ncbi:hypothetical protein T484DRAFT_1967838 [Baffinella frigidus]|nr:hypothetical protein T484DRAFT_1967838 [Cryptophyta sp. CCMP2293]
MISSNELAAETMKDLSSARSFIVGGSFVFLDPNSDIKKIRQLPKLRSEKTLPADNVRLHRALSEAPTPAVPRDTFPQQKTVSRTKSMPFMAIQAAVRFSRGSSKLKSRVSTSAEPTCSDTSENSFSIRRARARSFSLEDDQPLRVDRVVAQKSVRVFAPSSRFGVPSDWKKGASLSWAQLNQRRTSSEPGVSRPEGESRPLRPATGLRRASCSDASGVFQPVRPSW